MDLITETSSCEDLEKKENDHSNFPLAIKMMFNYDAESNAMSILRAMHRETVPAMTYSSNEEIMSWEGRYDNSYLLKVFSLMA